MDVKLQAIAGGIPASAAKKTGSTGASASPAPNPTSDPSADQSGLKVAELTQRLLAEPEVDSARVSRVAGQIQSGTYQANPQRAADNLIRMELAFR